MKTQQSRHLLLILSLLIPSLLSVAYGAGATCPIDPTFIQPDQRQSEPVHKFKNRPQTRVGAKWNRLLRDYVHHRLSAEALAAAISKIYGQDSPQSQQAGKAITSKHAAKGATD